MLCNIQCNFIMLGAYQYFCTTANLCQCNCKLPEHRSVHPTIHSHTVFKDIFNTGLCIFNINKCLYIIFEFHKVLNFAFHHNCTLTLPISGICWLLVEVWFNNLINCQIFHPSIHPIIQQFVCSFMPLWGNRTWTQTLHQRECL